MMEFIWILIILTSEYDHLGKKLIALFNMLNQIGKPDKPEQVTSNQQPATSNEQPAPSNQQQDAQHSHIQ